VCHLRARYPSRQSARRLATANGHTPEINQPKARRLPRNVNTDGATCFIVSSSRAGGGRVTTNDRTTIGLAARLIIELVALRIGRVVDRRIALVDRGATSQQQSNRGDRSHVPVETILYLLTPSNRHRQNCPGVWKTQVTFAAWYTPGLFGFSSCAPAAGPTVMLLTLQSSP
jgi:hypothetical protein